MRYLLISECLQRDFVAPLVPGAPLPNALHIGRAESRRLLGDPEGDWRREGPLARFLRAWDEGAGAEHAAVHVRDWHDPADPATRDHLEHFGPHCLCGTEGAGFVPPLDAIAGASDHHVVDSAILSDFVGTGLDATLDSLLGGEPARAGIVGVWTDVKVRYLAYDLMTRRGLREVAVCSALVASRSRIHHREALEHLAGSLGVRVVDGIPEFLAWLGIGWAPPPAAARRGAVPEIGVENAALDDEERRLVEHLFRDARRVEIAPLSGGFSGSRVFRTASWDAQGRAQVPFVVKIDAHDRVARERVAVESVENLLGAASPRMADYVDLETRGALKYQFATMHGGAVRTLQSALRDAPDAAAAGAVFENVVARVLDRLYQAPVLDARQLFREYQHRTEYAAHTLERVARLAEREEGDRIRIPGLAEPLPHPAAFYRRLDALRAEDPVEVACCWIHGDLNLANVLLDESGNTWLIDYFWTRVGHALQDVAKLENDLKFLMVPLADGAALERAVAWERELLGWEDLRSAPPRGAVAAGDDALGRAAAAIRVVRGLASRLLAEARAPSPSPAREYRIAQLRYAAHTLSFDECGVWQKRFALASVALLAERI